MKIVRGFEICGYENNAAKSGMTVIFPPIPNVTSVYVAGGSPGTRDTEVIDVGRRKDHTTHAIAIVGRSMYGLRAVEGVIESLRKKDIGFKINNIVVPIVPSAVIFDFYYNNIMPDDSWGINCYKNKTNDVMIGSHWAGIGATVGKIAGIRYMMESGQGFYKENIGIIEIGVLTVVNSIGEVIDDKGNIIAGVKINGKIVPSIQLLKENALKRDSKLNTTIGIVMTNVKASVDEIKSIAKSAYIGISRRIRPVSLSLDGDTIFAITSNEIEYDIDIIKGLTEEIASKSVLSIWGDKN